jgi:hypothetical protein
MYGSAASLADGTGLAPNWSSPADFVRLRTPLPVSSLLLISRRPLVLRPPSTVVVRPVVLLFSCRFLRLCRRTQYHAVGVGCGLVPSRVVSVRSLSPLTLFDTSQRFGQ